MGIMGGMCSSGRDEQIQDLTTKVAVLEARIGLVQSQTTPEALFQKSVKNSVVRQNLAAGDADASWGYGDYDVKGAQQATAKGIFQAADVNNDSKLTLEEIQAYLKKNPETMELLENAAGDAKISKEFAKAKAEDPERSLDETAFVDFYVARCQ